MDDDAPLSALARQPKIDDDTPLASLAEAGGRPRASPKAAPRGSPKAAPRGSPKAAGKAKAAAKGRPKRGRSSSSSSSSDSESSSSSNVKRPGTQKRTKMKVLQKQQTEDGLGEDGGGAVKKRDRSAKEQVVADLLCRWWYVLPDWPPTDQAHYEAELARRSLRLVSVAEWEWVPEEDEKGRRKVYELSQFKGLFRMSSGELVDARPRESCPCYTNFMKKDLVELYDLLVVAFENQLKDLKNSKYNEKQFEQELLARLTSVREKAYKAKQSGVHRVSKSG